MLARFSREWYRNWLKAATFAEAVDFGPWASLRWARKDSRPLLKAKEPRGRAESDRRRRACSEGAGVVKVVMVWVWFGLLWYFLFFFFFLGGNGLK